MTIHVSWQSYISCAPQPRSPRSTSSAMSSNPIEFPLLAVPRPPTVNPHVPPACVPKLVFVPDASAMPTRQHHSSLDRPVHPFIDRSMSSTHPSIRPSMHPSPLRIADHPGKKKGATFSLPPSVPALPTLLPRLLQEGLEDAQEGVSQNGDRNPD